MRFHIVSLPHTQVTRDYDFCAYTAKVRRFSSMMKSLGHETFVYAGFKSEVDATEHVTVVSSDDLQRWFGHPEWPTNSSFSHWNADHPCWAEMNAHAIAEINARFEPGDFIGIIGGNCQLPIYEAFKDRARVVEWGIGYEGTVSDFRVFESYAWMHHVAGLQGQRQVKFYDAVIPNSYDEEDFEPLYTRGSYLLFLARPTEAKGMQIVREIAKRSSLPVVTAGQGPGWLEGAEHRGVVLGKEKAELLAGAAALLSPTMYLEPFGGVTIEAMLSGTPVITTNWGVYSETVKNGMNGFRCSTLREFLSAVERVQGMSMPLRVSSRRAGERYLTTRVRYEYENYFHRLAELDGDGWYSL